MVWVVLIGYLRNIVSSKVIGIERIITAIFTNWLRRTWLRLKQIRFFFFFFNKEKKDKAYRSNLVYIRIHIVFTLCNK